MTLIKVNPRPLRRDWKIWGPSSLTGQPQPPPAEREAKPDAKAKSPSGEILTAQGKQSSGGKR